MNKLDELKDLITALQKKEEEKQKNVKKGRRIEKSEKVKMLHAAIPERKRARKVQMRKQSCASFFSPSAV